MRFSISLKLISLVTATLLITTYFIATESSRNFEQTLTERENFSNLETAQSRLKEVDATLMAIKSRIDAIGTMMVRKSLEVRAKGDKKDEKNAEDEVALNFNRDKSILAISIYQQVNGRLQLMDRRMKEDFEKTLGAKYIDTLHTPEKIPFKAIAGQDKSIEIVNSCQTAGPPLLTIGMPLREDEFGNVTHLALADVEIGVLQKTFSTKSARTLFLTDKDGIVLAHEEETLALNHKSLADLPIVARAIKDDSGIPTQSSYIDPVNHKHWIAAFAKSPFGVTVYSQIDKEVVLEPAKEVRNQAVEIAGKIIAVALLVSFFFSITITAPIEKLASLIALVAKGNFAVKARALVRSHDEVGDLAIAFDHMIAGLKERDKAKMAMRKFLGSSVAESILKNEIAVGGKNKEVTVLFSDIRGFTSFSEKHKPEEVVAMLNEYFEIMVGIVRKNKGEVDKFIGDAIMAMWGAPAEDPNDTANAVKAALEMRQALVKLNVLRETRGQPPIKIGVGLHCGRAIAGNIGSDQKMEYTIIGDTVNMTSRIEASTKAFGADMLVSEAIFDKVQSQFVFELGGAAEVKGKTEPLKLYKVRGLKNAAGEVELITSPYSDFEPEHADKVKVA